MAKSGARLILAARFLFFCMEIGLAKSFGVLVPELEEQLQTSNAIVGLITSFVLGTAALASPITKMMLQRCSNPRVLTSFCGLGAGCSLIAASFSRNLALMGLLFISVGFCMSVINIQALVLLREYYDESFAFVSCISVLGIPLGSAIFPMITEKFLERYGLNGALVLVGALLLNMLPIGLMLRAPGKKEPSRCAGENDVATVDGTEVEEARRLSRATNEFAKEYVQLPEIDITSHYPDVKVDLKSLGMVSSIKTGGNTGVVIHTIGQKLPSQEYHGVCCNEMVEYQQAGKDTTDSLTTNEIHRDSSTLTVVPHKIDGSIVASCLSYFYLDVIIKEPLFFIFYLPTIVLLFLVTGGWALFVVLYAVEHGIDIARGTYLATSGAIGGVLASVLVSLGVHYRSKWSPQFWIKNNILYAAMFFLQTLSSTYGYLLVISFLIGFGLSAVNVMLEAVLSVIVEKENFADAGTMFFVALGIGYMGSGYVAGYVQDRTGNTEALFIFLGVLSTIGLVLFSTMIIIFKRKRLCQT